MWALPVFLITALMLTSFNVSFWGTIAFGLLVVLIYNWNVAEKMEKSWRFFHALPISFLEKTVVKVAVPFLVSFLICVLATRIHFLKQVINGDLNDALLTSATLVLASILGRGAISFAMWAVGLSTIHLLPNNGPAALICAALYLTAATIYLSEKRIQWNSASLRVAAGCIPLALLLHYSRVPVLNFALRSKSPEIRLIAADQLFYRQAEDRAKGTVEDTLLTSNETSNLQKAVSILEKHDAIIDIPKERWLTLLSLDSDLRNEILVYIRHNIENFSWVDVEFLRHVEIDAISNNRRCKDDCRSLARLAGELSKAGNLSIDEYIRSRLSSVDTGKIIYGLHAAQYANLNSYQPEILKLLEHSNKDVREESEDLLQDMVGRTVDLGSLGDFLEKIDSDLTEVEKKKLREIIDDIVLPNLKISAELR
jgi:hypothetical protein